MVDLDLKKERKMRNGVEGHAAGEHEDKGSMSGCRYSWQPESM